MASSGLWAESSSIPVVTCNSATAHSSASKREQATVIVRVGTDGRVIDVEIERSSGSPVVDEALKACARSWGPFPLAIVDGRLLEFWERIEWKAM